MIDRRNYSIAQYLEDTKQNIEDMKATQPIGGQSFVNYPYSSGNSYDASVGVAANSYGAIEITYTHTEPNTYNIVKLKHFLRVDNSDVMASPYTPTVSGTIRTRLVTEAPAHGVTKWIIDVANTDASPHTIFLKFYFSGTVTGTFSTTTL